MTYKPIAFLLAALCLTMLSTGPAVALNVGDTIVGNVFVTGFDGWSDTNAAPGGWSLPPAANWGVLLTETENLIEACNTVLGVPGVNPPANPGTVPQCDVWKMVNLNYSTPSEYTLSAKIGSWDDDGFGLIFGYQDEGNYYRVSCRAQTGNSLGYASGVSVQKVTTVGGVTTYTMLGTQNATIAGQLPGKANVTGGVIYDLQVAVSGTTATVKGNFSNTGVPAGTMTTYVGNATDADLPTRAAGHYGVQSWAQNLGTATKARGTEVQSVTVASTGGLNKTTTFADVMPINWRLLKMYNAAGAQATGTDDSGNFRQDFRNGTIIDDSNSYEWATNTPTTANIDFRGQAAVVNETGNGSWTDYEMTTRVKCIDNEGPGVLVRVQDDKTFYRINFAAEPIIGDDGSYTYQRAPQGLSIQKCDGRGGSNPVWTELYRDNQASPLFVYSYGATTVKPFDLKVDVIGNTIKVQVINDPDGAATVIDYPTVTDASSPILSGSVALANWGGGGVSSGPTYSPYGGQAGHALLTYIPEPSMLALLALLALGWLGRRRR
jgi:hypothetical protein